MLLGGKLFLESLFTFLNKRVVAFRIDEGVSVSSAKAVQLGIHVLVFAMGAQKDIAA